jgi:hypothetical protein
MSPKIKPLSRVNEETIQLLTKELGAADTARFIRQFTTGTGDYTEERRERFAETSLDDLLEEIEERRGRNS